VPGIWIGHDIGECEEAWAKQGIGGKRQAFDSLHGGMHGMHCIHAEVGRGGVRGPTDGFDLYLFTRVILYLFSEQI